jgi:hypothetical protein
MVKMKIEENHINISHTPINPDIIYTMVNLNLKLSPTQGTAVHSTGCVLCTAVPCVGESFRFKLTISQNFIILD